MHEETNYILVDGHPSRHLTEEEAQEIVEFAVDFHDIDLKIHNREKCTFLVHKNNLKTLLEDDSGDFSGLHFKEERGGFVVGFELIGTYFDSRLTPEKVCKLVQKKILMEIEFVKDLSSSLSSSSSSPPQEWKFMCKNQEEMESLLSWDSLGVMKTFFHFIPLEDVGSGPLNITVFHDTENCFIEKEWGGNASELYDLVLREAVDAVFPGRGQCLDIGKDLSVKWMCARAVFKNNRYCMSPRVIKQLQDRMVTMLEPKQKLGGVDILLHQELGNFERDFCDFNEARKKSTIVVVISGDSDFAYQIVKLRRLGCSLVLIENGLATEGLKGNLEDPSQILNWFSLLDRIAPIGLCDSAPLSFSSSSSLSSSPSFSPSPSRFESEGRLVREVKKPVAWLLERLLGFSEVEKELDLPPTVRLKGQEKDGGGGGGVKLFLKEEIGEDFSPKEMFGFCEKVRKYLDGVKEEKVWVAGCSRASLVEDFSLMDLVKEHKISIFFPKTIEVVLFCQFLPSIYPNIEKRVIDFCSNYGVKVFNVEKGTSTDSHQWRYYRDTPTSSRRTARVHLKYGTDPQALDSLLSIHNPDFRLTIEAGGGGDGGLVLLYHRPAEGTPQIQLPSWAKIQGTEEVQIPKQVLDHLLSYAVITKEVYKTGERIHLLKEQKFDFPIKFWVEKKREKELVGLFRGGSEDVKRAIEEWEGVFQSIEISALEADPFIFHSTQFQLRRFNHLKHCLKLLAHCQMRANSTPDSPAKFHVSIIPTLPHQGEGARLCIVFSWIGDSRQAEMKEFESLLQTFDKKLYLLPKNRQEHLCDSKIIEKIAEQQCLSFEISFDEGNKGKSWGRGEKNVFSLSASFEEISWAMDAAGLTWKTLWPEVGCERGFIQNYRDCSKVTLYNSRFSNNDNAMVSFCNLLDLPMSNFHSEGFEEGKRSIEKVDLYGGEAMIQGFITAMSLSTKSLLPSNYITISHPLKSKILFSSRYFKDLTQRILKDHPNITVTFQQKSGGGVKVEGADVEGVRLATKMLEYELKLLEWREEILEVEWEMWVKLKEEVKLGVKELVNVSIEEVEGEDMGMGRGRGGGGREMKVEEELCGLKIRLQVCDWPDLTVDGLVCPVDNFLRPSGPLARSIFEAGGASFTPSDSKMFLGFCNVQKTQAGTELKRVTQKMIQVVAPPPMGPYSEAIKNVMEAGRKEGLKLLGIPFGCGTEGWKDKDAAREFVLGLKLFLEEVSQEDTGIEEIIIFGTSSDRVNKLKMALLADKQSEKKFNLNPIKLSEEKAPPPFSSVNLMVFGEQEHVKTEIQKIRVLQLSESGLPPLVYSLGSINFEKNYQEMKSFLERYEEERGLCFALFGNKLVIITPSREQMKPLIEIELQKLETEPKRLPPGISRPQAPPGIFLPRPEF